MKRLLLVDDEVRMLQLLKLYLEPHGFECITKTNGHEAINYLKIEDIRV